MMIEPSQDYIHISSIQLYDVSHFPREGYFDEYIVNPTFYGLRDVKVFTGEGGVSGTLCRMNL